MTTTPPPFNPGLVAAAAAENPTPPWPVPSEKIGRLVACETAATALTLMGWLFGAAGLIFGLILISKVHDDYGYDRTRPYLGVGLGVMVASVVLAIWPIFIGAWAKAWTAVQD